MKIHHLFSQDMDVELAAMGYTIRKLWSGVRTMWRNSPRSSSSVSVQALKDLMRERKNSDEEIQSCMPCGWGYIRESGCSFFPKYPCSKIINLKGVKILWSISFMYII